MTSILKLPQLPEQEDYNTESFLDNQEVATLNKNLIDTTLKLREVNKRLDYYSRKKLEAEVLYKHKYRETLLETEAKTESQKKLLAELECENEEIKVLYLEEMIKELTRLSYSLKSEIETMKILGNNIRVEMRL